MDTKRCTKCGVEKPRTEFYQRPSRPVGVTSECKACTALRTKEHRRKHGETIRAQRRQRYAAQRARIRTQQQASYQRNREKRLAATHALYQQHSGRWIAYWHTRRARRYGVSGDWSWDEWQSLCERYGNRCLCCGATEALTIDHVVPLE